LDCHFAARYLFYKSLSTKIKHNLSSLYTNEEISSINPCLISFTINDFLATSNLSNANSIEDNPLPFLPPFQHSQSHSQLQPSPQQPQHQQQINQPTQKQPLNSNELSKGHKNQFDNHSPAVTSIMPF
jgi:hypothetical protein